jgi:magnesium transporter
MGNHEMHYRRNSVGAAMTPRVPQASPTHTLRDIQRMLHEHARSFDTINYIYILDDENRLVGVQSLRELYHHDGKLAVGDVCRRHDLVTLPPDAPQARAAYEALRHNLKGVPIIDAHHHFLGVIGSDVLLSILYKETHGNLMRLAGIHGAEPPPFDNVMKISPWKSLRHRIPWLFLGLLGGLFSARIIGFFEGTLEEHLILASFIPLIVYMSDAVGTQMEAFIIRDLAIEHRLKFRKYFFRQLSSVLSIGVLFGLLLLIGTTVFFEDFRLGLTLGLSLALAILSAIVSGLLIPFFFSRLKFDPANASGPIATILQDILSVFIYFSVATLLL